MAGRGGPAHQDAPVVATAAQLPGWARLLRAANPGPMTLDGTNSWLLRLPGVGTVAVDPGPRHEAHLRAIAGAGPLAGILITHSHPDHVDGLARLRALTGAPVLTEVPGVTRLVTPGHTGDSVCFLVEVDGQPAVLTGDTILGRGTTVVAHPDGHLGDYLRSLDTLAGFAGLPALPGHGPALTDTGAAARFYLAHRRARLAQVAEVLAAGAGTPREIVRIVYADVDPALWPAAEWSVRAQLEYLGATGQPAGGQESERTGVRWDTP